MSLLFITIAVCVVTTAAVVYGTYFVPKTNIEELNRLLSIDESNLLIGKLTHKPKGPGILSDFEIFGNHLLYHYTDRFEGDTYVQTVNIVVFSTKARLCVSFEEERLTYLEYKESWISVPEIYFEDIKIKSLESTYLFVAHRAPILGERIAPKRLQEAQVT